MPAGPRRAVRPGIAVVIAPGRRGLLSAMAAPAGMAALAALAAFAISAPLDVIAAQSTPASAEIVVRDDLRREVRLPRPALRVVSLAPSLTETVCALGECTRLVAVDRYSDWPPEVRALPKAGGLDDTPIETIVRLNPDVVLAFRSTRAIERLDRLGVRTVAIDADRFADVARVVTLVGAVLGVPERAVLLNRRIDADLDAIAKRALAARGDRQPSVYFEIDGAFFAAGRASFIGELLERLGARNVVPAALGPFPQVNGELVVRADPDILMLSAPEAGRVAARPGWSGLRAVREKRICTFPPDERDAIVRPGPRVVDGLRALAACLDRTAP